jgi:hypothetical protein
MVAGATVAGDEVVNDEVQPGQQHDAGCRIRSGTGLDRDAYRPLAAGTSSRMTFEPAITSPAGANGSGERWLGQPEKLIGLGGSRK